MQKGKKLLLFVIILFACANIALYYYKEQSNNLNKADFSRSFKTSEVQTKGLISDYSLKQSDDTAQQDTMTEEQVIKYLGISSGELTGLIEGKNSNFPYIKSNDTYTFKKVDIDKWLEKCHVNALIE
jgi:hypothetical protein